mmetsp:Transcript_41791/g.53867  ORF Transcript_41791/g.53867 Transcript_41791/m.53867 type:complete len:146 (+) Transcript_41791:338-775(+)
MVFEHSTEELSAYVPNSVLESETSFNFMVRAIVDDGLATQWTERKLVTPVLFVLNDESVCIKAKSFKTLHSYFDNKSVELTLLYRGSRDGFEPHEFHAKCDGANQTLTVIKTTTGYTSGGFRPSKWNDRTTQGTMGQLVVFFWSG